MHLLQTSSTTFDDIVEPVDLGQTPGDILVLSFADSDLSGLAAAWKADAERLPSMRLAALRDLRHPMSVDIWIDRVPRHAHQRANYPVQAGRQGRGRQSDQRCQGYRFERQRPFSGVDYCGNGARKMRPAT